MNYLKTIFYKENVFLNIGGTPVKLRFRNHKTDYIRAEYEKANSGLVRYIERIEYIGLDGRKVTLKPSRTTFTVEDDFILLNPKEDKNKHVFNRLQLDPVDSPIAMYLNNTDIETNINRNLIKYKPEPIKDATYYVLSDKTVFAKTETDKIDLSNKEVKAVSYKVNKFGKINIKYQTPLDVVFKTTNADDLAKYLNDKEDVHMPLNQCVKMDRVFDTRIFKTENWQNIYFTNNTVLQLSNQQTDYVKGIINKHQEYEVQEIGFETNNKVVKLEFEPIERLHKTAPVSIQNITRSDVLDASRFSLNDFVIKTDKQFKYYKGRKGLKYYILSDKTTFTLDLEDGNNITIESNKVTHLDFIYTVTELAKGIIYTVSGHIDYKEPIQIVFETDNQEEFLKRLENSKYVYIPLNDPAILKMQI